MLRNFLLLVTCCLLAASCDSCKKNNPPAAKQEHPAQEYAQIPLIQNLTQKIAEDNNNPDLYYERGVAYNELGNQQNAIADVTKAIQLDSANAGYYQMLGEIYYKKQDY